MHPFFEYAIKYEKPNSGGSKTIKQLNIPWIYENKSGNPKFEKFVGRPKLSYSFYNSFLEEGYAGELFGTKFLGEEREGNVFTEYGSAVGEYLERRQQSELLSDFDISVLEKENPADQTCLYEYEIVVDRGSYVIQGFIDKLKRVGKKSIVIDYKTGAIDKKAKEYANIKYQQTTLYAYSEDLEGQEVEYSGVVLFDRRGNVLEKESKNNLRLTGEIEHVPTPYTRERAEKFLEKFDKTAIEIEEYWRVFNKYFKH